MNQSGRGAGTFGVVDLAQRKTNQGREGPDLTTLRETPGSSKKVGAVGTPLTRMLTENYRITRSSW
jgi:hypothetical protein